MSSTREALHQLTAVVVTGGSSGIGKSIIDLVRNLSPETLICNLSRRPPDIKLPELKLRHISCDLSHPAQVEAGAREVLEALRQEAPEGKVLLVNNSGFGGYGRFPEPGLPHWLEMLDVNVRAVIHLTGLLLPEWKRRGGAVMTVASTAAFQPTPFLAVYGAGKAFLMNWSLALNEELRGTGVRTLVVCPGPTDTPFFKRAGLTGESQSGRMGMSADEVARMALEALARGESLVVTGWRNRLMASVAGGLPRRLVARAAARVLGRHRMDRVKQ